jgi:glycosyltransferase involved in cell wall biosynthesis
VAPIISKALARLKQRTSRLTGPWQRPLEILKAQILAKLRKADLAIFNEFMPPPYGGGNQFLLALRRKFDSLGWRTEVNVISSSTRACLYNSFNFDFDRLRRFKRPGCRMVHRVDGPIGVYRGWDDGTDERIWQINHELADATVFQSHYSLMEHLKLGLKFINPVVISNAVDPAIFHARGRLPFDRGRKIRLISSSWSDNPNKGAPFLRHLEENLDWSRFEYTFVGRSPIRFQRLRMIDPVPSHQVADLLRAHDIYIAASRNDPCSNSVIEALSCGLPCLYLMSGGHPELVGEAGIPFTSEEEALAGLERLVQEYEERQAKIFVPSIDEVANRYLAVMGINPDVGAA